MNLPCSKIISNAIAISNQVVYTSSLYLYSNKIMSNRLYCQSYLEYTLRYIDLNSLKMEALSNSIIYTFTNAAPKLSLPLL